MALVPWESVGNFFPGPKHVYTSREKGFSLSAVDMWPFFEKSLFAKRQYQSLDRQHRPLQTTSFIHISSKI